MAATRVLLAGLACAVGCTTGTPARRDAPAVPLPTPVVAPGAPATSTTPGAPAVAGCIDDARPFDPEVMRARLETLAAPALDGRASGTAGDREARQLVAARFRCLGLVSAGDDAYEQPFADAHGAATANVVGFIKGATLPDEIVMIGAHHDHLGGGLLGANDNASGVVGLLAIAQAVAQRAPPARTIAFVTFSAEEQGLVGSRYYAAHPPASLPLARVVQYINLDMIGSHASRNRVWAFGAFAKQPARKLLRRLAVRFPAVKLGIGGHSVRGDHLGFCEHKIPYVFLWTPDARCYHEPCDTADKVDYPHLAMIAELAGDLATTLADSKLDLVASKQAIGCFGR